MKSLGIILLLLAFAPGNQAALPFPLPIPVVIPWFSTNSPNTMSKVYNDVKGQIREVNTFKDVVAGDLMRYGVVRIKDSKSVIVNTKLASNVLDENYKPSVGTNARNITNMISHDFVELSFSKAEYECGDGDWTPLGPIRKNEASEKESVSQGWSIASGVTLTSSLAFGYGILGFSPGGSINANKGASGTIQCDIPPKGQLQMLTLAGATRVSGVKERKISVEGDYPFTLGLFTSLKVGSYEDVESHVVPSSLNVQTKCITDPDYFEYYK